MKKNKIDKLKKPDPIFYPIFQMICRIVSKCYFNLKILRNELKGHKGSCVIIANHESITDFINLYGALKQRAHFVVSKSFFEGMPIQPLLKAVGVIPKNQFQTGIDDLRNMRRALKNDLPLVLYPAGLMTPNGVSTPIPTATGKALKWFKKDVYVAYISGSYLTYPKWSKKNRKGQVMLDIYKLYSEKDLENLDECEVQKRLEKELFFDAYKTQIEKKIEYKNGNDINGLQNVIFRCPKCGTDFALDVIDNSTLKCSCCDFSLTANKYGLFDVDEENQRYASPSEITKDIEKQLYDEINEKRESFKLESHALLKMIDYKKHKFVEVGECNVSLDYNHFIIKGLVNGEEFERVLNIDFFPTLPFSPGVHMEIQEDKEIYRIILDNKKEMSKWVSAIKIIHHIKNGRTIEEDYQLLDKIDV